MITHCAYHNHFLLGGRTQGHHHLSCSQQGGRKQGPARQLPSPVGTNTRGRGSLSGATSWDRWPEVVHHQGWGSYKYQWAIYIKNGEHSPSNFCNTFYQPTINDQIWTGNLHPSNGSQQVVFGRIRLIHCVGDDFWELGLFLNPTMAFLL